MDVRVTLYARYSTDHQSPASIEDQFRICRARAAREEWTVVAELGDDATSGSTNLRDRRAGRELAASINTKCFNILLVESLDRLSRDQMELEGWMRRMEHGGIRIIGVSDGYDSLLAGRKLMRGFRGLFNEVFLDDLRAKTHRGQTGKVLTGYVAGGSSYGYDLVRHGDPENPLGSTYQVNDAQADWVRQIFDRYAAGESCRKIVYFLNELGVPSPRGNKWGVSALYGNPRKGSGILNNSIYIGRYIWNRSQWIQDPDTKRRQRIDRPRNEWHEREDRELRIVEQATWERVRARIDHGRDKQGQKPQHRPRSGLFSGIMICPHCDGPLTVIDASAYGCGRAKDRGPTVCRGFRIKRAVADERLAAVIRADLLSAEAAADFARMLEEEVSALRSAAIEGPAPAATERLASVRAEINRLVEAICVAGHSDALMKRLGASERELASLEALTIPRLSAPGAPKFDASRVFAEKLEKLDQELAKDAQAARNLIAELVGKITIELRGDEVWARLATDRLVHLAAGPSSDNVVAGTGFEPVTFGL